VVDYSRPRTPYIVEPPLKAQLYRVFKLYSLITLLASITTWLMVLQMMMIHISPPPNNTWMRGEVKKLISPLVTPISQEYIPTIQITLTK
jgi:uncharacterized protein YggT (Ycf19 family)